MSDQQLRKWAIGVDNTDPYLAPELRQTYLMGIRVGDDLYVKTSRIIGKKYDKIITNSGTHYILLDVDPEYEAMYPNALQRVMNSIKEIQ